MMSISPVQRMSSRYKQRQRLARRKREAAAKHKLRLELLEPRMLLAADGLAPFIVEYDLNTGVEVIETEAEAAQRLASSGSPSESVWTEGSSGSQLPGPFDAPPSTAVDVDPFAEADWAALEDMPPTNRFDVDGDGFESPRDVLKIVNHLNSTTQAADTASEPVEAATLYSLDASQDGDVSPIDVLMVVNRLNSTEEPTYENQADSNDPLTDGSVFGTDNRSKITATTSYPYRTKGFMRFQLSNGSWAGCSGTMISDIHFLTAGHCVHDGNYATQAYVTLGQNGSYRPYGEARALNFTTNTAWTGSSDPNHDWAVVRLDRQIGDNTGWMGWAYYGNNSTYNGMNVKIGGYPADLASSWSSFSSGGQRVEHWQSQGNMVTPTAGQLKYNGTLDTSGGMSGSGVMQKKSGSSDYLHVVGVHAYGDGGNGTNEATRLRQYIHDILIDKRNNDPKPTDKADLTSYDSWFKTTTSSVTPSSSVVGGSVTPRVWVRNNGTANASSFKVRFRLSTNTVYTTSDTLLGDVTINSLSELSHVAATKAFTVPNVPNGQYYVVYSIDAFGDVAEFSEGNNRGAILNQRLTVMAGGNGPTVPAYSSLPSADHTIYLDFNGHVVSGTTWNNSTYYNSSTIVADPYDTDGNTNSFSSAELAQIKAAWEEAAEDYRPFNVNVTTVEPSLSDLRKTSASDTRWGVRAIMTKESSLPRIYCGCGGIAFIGSFNWDTDTPVWVFNGSSSSQGQTISHEVGHALSLSHDGKLPSTTYYDGHGTGSRGWGPIMGAPFGQNVVQFSKGDYYQSNNDGASANYGNGPNDLQVITTLNGFGYRPDDHGNDVAGASELGGTGSSVLDNGIITRRGDYDVFRFVHGGGALSLTVKPFNGTSGPFGTNLDVKAQLLSANGSVLNTAQPEHSLSATISRNLQAGVYYLKVDGDAWGSPNASSPSGWNDYGSLGKYKIIGTINRGPTGGPLVTVDNVSKLERDSGFVWFKFPVKLSSAPTSPVSVRLKLIDLTATLADNDYRQPPIGDRTITFNPGDPLSKNFVVKVNGDTKPEANEKFRVKIVTITGPATLGDGIAQGTIRNDDGSPAAADIDWGEPENPVAVQEPLYLEGETHDEAHMRFFNEQHELAAALYAGHQHNHNHDPNTDPDDNHSQPCNCASCCLKNQLAPNYEKDQRDSSQPLDLEVGQRVHDHNIASELLGIPTVVVNPISNDRNESLDTAADLQETAHASDALISHHEDHTRRVCFPHVADIEVANDEAPSEEVMEELVTLLASELLPARI